MLVKVVISTERPGLTPNALADTLPNISSIFFS